MNIILRTVLFGVVAGVACAGQLEEFQTQLADVSESATKFRSAARTQLRRGGPDEVRLLAASGDLARSVSALSQHMAARSGAATLNADLDAIGGARDAIEATIGRVRPSGNLKAQWASARQEVDGLLAAAQGEAPPSRRPPTVVDAPATPKETRISLIGPDELHHASADLSVQLDAFAVRVRRGRPDGRRAAALAALGNLRTQLDAIAGGPTLEDIRPEARKLGALINSADRALAALPDYHKIRADWQVTRNMAVGINRFGK